MKRTLNFLIVTGAILGLLALVFYGQTGVNSVEHDRFDHGLDMFIKQDMALNQDVLKIQFHLLDDYDGLSDHIRDLKLALNRLTPLPSFVSTADRKLMAGKIQEIAKLLGQKEQLLEKFKSQQAILNISERYLPLAAIQLLGRLSTNDESRMLETPLNELLRQLQVYNLDPNDDLVAPMNAALAKMTTWQVQHEGHREIRALASIMAHAKSIIRRKPQVEAVTREIVSLPTGTRAGELLSRYDNALAGALSAEDIHRRVLQVLCGLLVIGVAFALGALALANRNLERRVAERTADLELEIMERKRAAAELAETHKKLLTISHQAGMAEVATSVLHNVGNVLNSVNVSANLIDDRIRQLKLDRLGKVTDLLDQHAADPGAFLTTDERGRRLPAYLAQMAKSLIGKEDLLLAEVECLRKNVGHIKEIVAMQQNYALVSGVTEVIKVTDLVEDSLRLNAETLSQHEVKIVREFADVPAITVEKHKVLQILVNLIRNAKKACEESDRTDKQMTMRIANGDGRIKISVTDNGIGIPLENLARIFNHGFTTRKDGHGFGLHKSALAAKEMGGSLAVKSDGLGRGARFTLEIPVTQS